MIDEHDPEYEQKIAVDRVDVILEKIQVAMAALAVGYLVGTVLVDWLHWL